MKQTIHELQKNKINLLNKKTIIVLLALFTIGINAQQFGEIDPTFNVNNGIGANSNVYCTATQPDGKTIMVGDFTKYGTVLKNRICRLNIDGTIDDSFNSGTGFNGTVIDVKIQNDGKILIRGSFTTYNDLACKGIARLNTDGTLDITFTAGTFANGGFSTAISCIAIQIDGKILVGGIFTTYNGVLVKNFARLNIDGSLDTTFATTITQFQRIELVVIQPSGKILAMGTNTGSGQSTITSISRLNLDGSFDSTYNGSVIGAINDAQMQADGKLLIGGSFANYQGTPRNNIAQLNINGSLDTAFDPGTGTNNMIDNIKLLSNGKMIISGNFTLFNGVAKSRLATLNSDGSLDTTFDVGTNANFIVAIGENANRIIEKIAEKPNGKIIIVGKFISINGTSRGRLAQLNADGSIDVTFFSPSGIDVGSNNSIVSATMQADGKIVVAGSFTAYNSFPKIAQFRINTDGTIDSPFNPVTVSSGVGAVEYCIVVQPDGKTLLAGRHVNENIVLTGRLVRLNPENGALDTTFLPGLSSNTNGDVFTIALQPDGKILIGGVFSTYNGVTRNRIARLNVNGSIDATFDPVLGANNAVNTIVVQPDGKILIGGNFTNYNGISRNRIARLNSDGTLDTNFVIGNGANNEINAIAQQTNGKILIGGVFTAYDGNAKKSIARLNSDGSLDSSFGSGIGPNARVRTIKIKLDEKIIIGGDFTSYDGTLNNRIAFLNADGILDTNFDTGTGANNIIRDMLIQPDGKVIILGDFSSYNGIAVGRITRLISTPTTTLSTKEFTQKIVTIYPNPSTGIFNIQTENPLENATLRVADLNGRIVHESKVENLDNKTLDLRVLQDGIYILNVSNGSYNYSRKLVKQ